VFGQKRQDLTVEAEEEILLVESEDEIVMAKKKLKVLEP